MSRRLVFAHLFVTLWSGAAQQPPIGPDFPPFPPPPPDPLWFDVRVLLQSDNRVPRREPDSHFPFTQLRRLAGVSQTDFQDSAIQTVIRQTPRGFPSAKLQDLAIFVEQGEDVALAHWISDQSHVYLWNHPQRIVWAKQIAPDLLSEPERLSQRIAALLPDQFRCWQLKLPQVEIRIWSSPNSAGVRGEGGIVSCPEFPRATRFPVGVLRGPTNDPRVQIVDHEGRTYLVYTEGSDLSPERFPSLKTRLPSWSTERILGEIGARAEDRRAHQRDLVLLQELAHRMLTDAQFIRLLSLNPYEPTEAGAYFHYWLYHTVGKLLRESNLPVQHEKILRRALRESTRERNSFQAERILWELVQDPSVDLTAEAFDVFCSRQPTSKGAANYLARRLRDDQVTMPVLQGEQVPACTPSTSPPYEIPLLVYVSETGEALSSEPVPQNAPATAQLSFAREEVRRWHWRPATWQGVAVPHRVYVRVPVCRPWRSRQME